MRIGEKDMEMNFIEKMGLLWFLMGLAGLVVNYPDGSAMSAVFGILGAVGFLFCGDTE